MMDLKQEIEALDRIAASPVYSVEAAGERYTHLWLYGGTAEQVREAHQLGARRRRR